MSISDIFREANTSIFLERLRPVDADYFATLDTSDWANGEPMDFAMWQDAMRNLGLDPSRIHWNPDATMVRLYFYTGEYMSAEILHLNPTYLVEPFGSTERIIGADEHWRKVFLEEKNYAIYFFIEFNQFAISYFHRHVDKIDEDARYNAFRDMYLSCEYGFRGIDRDLAERMFRLADKDAVARTLDEAGHGDTVTIYRGEGSLSTPYTETYSWTTSLKTAKWFAHRFGDGNVYRAEVARDAIIDYIDDRNESEVWVRPRDLKRVKRIKA